MRKRILYCVLDWGLGHATRSIPIIRALMDRDCEVVIASDSLALEFLQNEFPALPTYALPSYDVKYRSTSLFINGIQNLKGIRSAITAEYAMMRRIVRDERIDAIISDNRYGCHLEGVRSVILTHQLRFRTGNAVQDSGGRIMIRHLMKPFDHIWVPDDNERTLSGVLSKSDDPRVVCIGVQSTLEAMKSTEQQDRGGSEIKPYDIAAILSGPEPQRTEFELEVHKQIALLKLECVLVRGVKGGVEIQEKNNITVFDVLDRKGINQIINTSSVILCRSGYSSLMDLHSLNKRAILVPTPGQPEQKYLGERMSASPQYVIQEQDNLNINTAYDSLINITPPSMKKQSSNLLETAIDNLLRKL